MLLSRHEPLTSDSSTCTWLKISFAFTDASQDESARREGDEEGDRKEPLRFESLEVTSLEQSVPDHLVKTYDEVREGDNFRKLCFEQFTSTFLSH